MGQLTAEEIAARVRDLPALPAIVTQVLRATRDSNTTAIDVANILATDQSLTAKVLRLANSALFGFPRRIGTLTDAVIMLGFSTLRSLVLASTAFSVLSRRVDGYCLDKGMLWVHSFGSGVACRLLARRANLLFLTEEAFVGGILHDVGKVVLDTYVGESYSQILSKVVSENQPFVSAERAILGYDHAEVGGLVTEAWGLPVELCEAIRFHHSPAGASGNTLLPQLVHVGDIVALSLGLGIGGDGLNYPMDPEAVAAVKLTVADLEEVMSDLPDAIADDSAWRELG